jgi:hypothetical protein
VDIRTDIVVFFVMLVSVTVIVLVFRSTYSTASEWWEEMWEWVHRRSLATQLLSKIEDRPREALLEIALAVALAPYNWPSRKSDDDEALARARERHLAAFTSLSDEELKGWIKEKVPGTHSFFLKVALDSLHPTTDSGG